MFWNGSTAIDGLSGSMSGDCDGVSIAGSKGLTRSPSRMRWTRTGRAMFLTCCSPMSSNEKELVAHLITHHAADADPAGLSQSLEPRCDIDPIAVDVAPVLNDIAEIDPHPELDPAIGRHIGVSLRHLALHFNGATHRVDDARKLDEQAVARSLHDPAAVFLDLWIGQLAPKRFQPFVRSLLISSHQARVARHIRGENGSQPAFEASRRQSGAPNRNGRLDHRLSGLILTVKASAAILFQ
jgi:hypothetical protein